MNIHADYLYAYAITRIRDEEQARDLVQDTFLAALEAIGQFEGKSSKRTWLTSILKNKIIDTYRKRSKLSIIERNGEPEMETQFLDADLNNRKEKFWPEPFGIEQDDPLENKELKLILQNCMQKLPVLWLAVFSMKYVDNESTATICSELKISDSNFWVIIYRTKINLRKCLQRNWLNT